MEVKGISQRHNWRNYRKRRETPGEIREREERHQVKLEIEKIKIEQRHQMKLGKEKRDTRRNQGKRRETPGETREQEERHRVKLEKEKRDTG